LWDPNFLFPLFQVGKQLIPADEGAADHEPEDSAHTIGRFVVKLQPLEDDLQAFLVVNSDWGAFS
jgi:hypothetical protein